MLEIRICYWLQFRFESSFWFIREDSEYFKMDGEEFIEKELDCKLSEKYNYVCRLDDYWNEWMKLNCEGLKFEVDGKI